jgi:hypothetical protein
MIEIPIPPCNNNRRTSMKCRRMCCRKVKPKVHDTTQQQRLFPLPTKSYDLIDVRSKMEAANALIFEYRRK